MRIVFFLMLYSGMACCQQPSWVLKIGDVGNDVAESVRELTPGNFYVSGYSASGNFGNSDFMLVKISASGIVGWTKYYGTPDDDFCLYMDTVSNKRLILAGQTTNAQAESDCMMVLTDSSGNVIWSRVFGGPGNQSLASVRETPDGGFIGTGFATDTIVSNDIYFVRLDAAGNILWDTTYGGADNEYAAAVRYHNGSYVISADTRSSGAGAYDVNLIKTDQAGNVTWDFTYGDSYNNGCQGLIITSDDHYLSFGETEISSFSYFDFFIEKIDSSGNSVWKRTFGGLSSDAAFSAVETSDGFLLTGYSNSYSPGPLNLVFMKVDTAGQLKWINNYGGPGVDIGYDLWQDVSGGVMICGKYSDSVLGSQAYILYFDSAQVVGIHDHPAEMIGVFPNPSRGDFQVSGVKAGSVADIFSLDGRLLDSLTLDESGILRIGRDVPPGIYFARIRGDKRSAFKLLLAR